MNASEIQSQLRQSHAAFANTVSALSATEFTQHLPEKWSAGLQLEHIFLSVKPLRMALRLPKLVLQLLMGKANRNSRSFDEVVQKYQAKLQSGGRATGRFVPKAVPIEQKEKLLAGLQKQVDGLCAAIDNFTETDLDTYLIPHPLLGRMTVREMLYFTIYHVQHHEKITIKNAAAC